MKTVKEVLSKFKGEDKVNQTVTGKGIFSRSGFGELTNALVNDTSFNASKRGKDGSVESINISELLRADMKKTLQNANYPQKSEADIMDTCDISTKGLSEAIPHIIVEYIKCGKKFDFPDQQKFGGSIYLAPVEARTKEINVRDIKTGDALGVTKIETKDSIQIRSKSPVPQHLQTKTRYDVKGNIVK